MSAPETVITFKPQHDLKPCEGRGDYVYGDNQDVFLRVDWSLEQVKSFVRTSNEPFVGLVLSNLRADTWQALALLLGDAAQKELKTMRTHCEYSDYYTNRFSPSLFPVLLLTRNLGAYARDEGYEPRHLEFASEAEHKLEQVLADLQSDEYECRIRLSRIAQVLMGTGYTNSCLPSDGDAIIDWQFAELTNGDILVLAGYEWFNK